MGNYIIDEEGSFTLKSREESLRDEYPELKELWLLFTESRDLNVKLRKEATFMSYIFHKRFNLMARIIKRTQRRLNEYEVTLRMLRSNNDDLIIGVWRNPPTTQIHALRGK